VKVAVVAWQSKRCRKEIVDHKQFKAMPSTRQKRKSEASAIDEEVEGHMPVLTASRRGQRPTNVRERERARRILRRRRTRQSMEPQTLFRLPKERNEGSNIG